ncbi:peptide deformylase [Arthrobacter sp. StoSoilB22]|uniref:peptide deformylase n=1 Tax=Arthrobacter sp. StoSoilB22 TaxID=2830996 RepID=UPI001CC7BAA5|nr:peptide deformylase [Arthrobacter sp. StoSoilB22]BCW63271.1 peptide deformylase 1 [Arthrobacter sp. StoSoilB22]
MTHQPHPGATSPATDYNPIRIRDAVRRLLDTEGLPPIIQAGHPVLRQLAAPYEGQLDDAELAAFIEQMRAVMHAAPGVGLAAPQLGIPLQVAVLEDRYPVEPESAAVRHREQLEFLAIVNPQYRPLGTETASFYEGCLSVSGYQAVVTRHRNVELRYTSPTGESTEAWYSGWQARIVQHETDHLHGILYLDRAELRSLSSNAEHSARWSAPEIDEARRALGFFR